MEFVVINFVLIVTRIAGFIGALPNIGSDVVPLKMRMGLVLALAWMWSTGPEPLVVTNLLSTSADWPLIAVIMVREAVLGALLGFLFRLFMMPARVAGAWLGQEMGLSMASLTSVSGEDSSSIVGHLMTGLATLMFFGLNVHHVIFLALDRSFVSWPVGEPIPQKLFAVALDALSMSHEIGLVIAGPAAVMLFLVLITLLLMGKASQHFNLMSIGLTTRVIAGLVSIVVFMPEIVTLLLRSLLQIESFAAQLF